MLEGLEALEALESVGRIEWNDVPQGDCEKERETETDRQTDRQRQTEKALPILPSFRSSRRDFRRLVRSFKYKSVEFPLYLFILNI